ncbi:MAG: phosphoglycerate mutase family protein [Saprospiraceae bacterium]
MSRLFFIIVIIGSISIFNTQVIAQSVTSDQTIFLVRHAEKADDGTRDPDLNAKGKRRALKLAEMLISFDIAIIYSTDYKRTRQTAAPLADALGLEVKLYDPRSKVVIADVKTGSGNILIVGHSNTTPMVTNAILGEAKYKQLDEKEYTKLFILARVSGAYGSAISEF